MQRAVLAWNIRVAMHGAVQVQCQLWDGRIASAIPWLPIFKKIFAMGVFLVVLRLLFHALYVVFTLICSHVV